MQNTTQIQLRPYQTDLMHAVYGAWNSGARNTLAVLPTGGGKTVLFSKIAHDNAGAVCAVAHRQELVGQISLALARDGLRHRIVGPKNVVRLIVQLHTAELGRSYYDPNAVHAVAGVDTLLARRDSLKSWARRVTLWVMDEGHHVLTDNKWGKAAAMFENARGLGVTATPLRADGNGLGAHVDGVYHAMIEGPSMRELINQGFLTDYRVFAPPSDINLGGVDVSPRTGDYVKTKLTAAVRKSHIVGDVVEHYQRIAAGKLGVTFATDVETATTIAAQFNAAGVPAAVVSAGTNDAQRAATLRKFRARQLLQLVNVDLFGEGFDLPAIEVVSMARPTQSYGLYCQQFGRALRPMDGKTDAIIIDHVGNVARHGLPDAPRAWSLDRRERRTSSAPDGAIKLRACPQCTMVYERIHRACPYCAYAPQPQSRSQPDQVDGDLLELDPETLAAMRGDVDHFDRDAEVYRAELAAKHVPHIGQLSLVKKHVAKQEAQSVLRAAIAQWAGIQRHYGRPDSESYRRFYFKFGVDVMSAQVLGVDAANELTKRITEDTQCA